MATAREAYEARLLASRYGPIGKVAGNYRVAGFQVKVISSSEDAPLNFIAWKKGGERLGVKVRVKSGPVDRSEIEALKAEAEKNNAKPILVLYGKGPRIARELVEEARRMGVSLKRVRF
ncbi:MAG: restriction endonuclease [Desulfurococcales archaeon]|nr:restriction endonuclease [Desulfurococcales archaeon]